MALRKPNPVTAVGGTWLTDKQWADFLDLAKQAAPVFKDLDSRFEKNLSGWEKAAASPEHITILVELPEASAKLAALLKTVFVPKLPASPQLKHVVSVAKKYPCTAAVV